MLPSGLSSNGCVGLNYSRSLPIRPFSLLAVSLHLSISLSLHQYPSSLHIALLHLSTVSLSLSLPHDVSFGCKQTRQVQTASPATENTKAQTHTNVHIISCCAICQIFDIQKHIVCMSVCVCVCVCMCVRQVIPAMSLPLSVQITATNYINNSSHSRTECISLPKHHVSGNTGC